MSMTSIGLRFFLIVGPLCLLLVLISCVPKTGDKAVEVNTAGVFDPVTFTIEGGTDLGEVLTGSNPVIVTITVKNNSRFEIINLVLTLFDDDESTMGMDFASTEGSGAPGFPGAGGTCDPKKLASGATCTIKLSMNPSRSGVFKQKIHFAYKNFVTNAEVEAKYLTVLIGEPASLVFPSSVSFFNYGVLEQTNCSGEYVKRETLMIENRGGLSARSVDLALGQTPLGVTAFKVETHNCPDVIKSGSGCQVTISYIPENCSEFDLPVDYSSTFTMSYIKDGKTASGQLNAFFQFKSLKIQGDFQTNQPVHAFTPDIIAGNYERKNISVSNKGYQSGIIKELIFRVGSGTGSGNLMGVCRKQLSGPYLDCDDGADPATPVSLATLPFRVEDLSLCMDELIPGIRGETPGETCIFRVTFWPSVEYGTNDRQFGGTELWFKYDSRWKDQETIIENKVFTFQANSKGLGKLIITDLWIDGVPQTDMIEDTETLRWFDLGRLALITSSLYRSEFKIRLLNVGNSPVTVNWVCDGQLPGPGGSGACASGAQEVTGNARTLDSQSDAGKSTYYEEMITGCTNGALDINGACFIQGFLSPIKQAGESLLQDRLFLDVIVRDGLDKPIPSQSWKSFSVSYRNSATYQDSYDGSGNGLAYPDKSLETRHAGLLVAKGMLAFENTDPNAGNLGSLSPYDKKIHKIVLKNVGTGPIPYIKIDNMNNLNINWGPYPRGAYKNLIGPGAGFGSGYDGLSLNTIRNGLGVTDTGSAWTVPGAPWASGTGSGWTAGQFQHDCYDLIRPPALWGGVQGDVSLLPDTGSFTTPLADGDRCALTVIALADPLERAEVVTPTYYTTYTEEARMNVSDWNNNEELWERERVGLAQTVTFQYYDGDVGLGSGTGAMGAPNYYNELGFYKSMSKTYTVQHGYWTPAKLTPTTVITPYDSAVVYRPPMTYPELRNDDVAFLGAGAQGTVSGWVTPEWWSLPTGAAEPAQRQILSFNHVKNVAGLDTTNANDSYTIHAGTFPATGETYPFTFSLKNLGGSGAVIRAITFNPPLNDASVKMAQIAGPTTFPTTVGVTSTSTFSFSFTPPTNLGGENPKLFDTEMSITWDDGVHTVAKGNPVISNYRLMAQAVESDEVCGGTGGDCGYAVGVSNYAADGDFKSRDWFVESVGTGPATKTLTGTINNIPLKTHAVDPGFVSVFEAVKGSIIYAQKRYTITNNSRDYIYPTIMIKTALGVTTYNNSPGDYQLIGTGPDADTCTNSPNLVPCSIDPGNCTCTFDIKFVASQSTPASSTAYVHINYDVLGRPPGDVSGNQYINKIFQVRFDATEPANLSAVGPTLSPAVLDTTTGLTWASYKIDFGQLASNPHIKQTTYPTIAGYPMTAPQNGVTVTNSSTLKASFLKQFNLPRQSCAVPPAGPPWTAPCTGPDDNKIALFTGGVNNQIHVFATRACFFGDDEYVAGIDDDSTGFNSLGTQICKLFFEYWADETYTGQSIPSGTSHAHLEFFNNKRASSDFMHFYVAGFVEPDFSTSPPGTWTAVQASSSGTITFTWPNFSGVNAAWGSKVGYRVFKATSSTALNNLYSNPTGYTDVGPTTHTHTFTSLTAGKYYYFKVAARRQKNAVIYNSLSSTPLNQLTVVVPPNGAVYTSTLGANGYLIDKNLITGFGFRAQGSGACGALKYTLNNGGTVYKTKQLITTPVWNYIMSDPDQTNFSTYSQYMPPATPHWLNDTPLPLSGAGSLSNIFSPYGFNTLNLDQYVPQGEGTPPAPTPLLYRKTCTNNSCENLEKMVGGDGVDVPFNAVFYIKGDQSAGAYRCFAPL